MKQQRFLRIWSFMFLTILVLPTTRFVVGQKRVGPNPNSHWCSTNNAVTLIQQQVDAAKLLDKTSSRIAVLVRAADVLWFQNENKAREVFKEAFELAERDLKESLESQSGTVSGPPIPPRDQRFVVIAAVAKRDRRWADELTDQVLRADNKEDPDQKGSQRNIAVASKLLESALLLLPGEIAAATMLAERSFAHPASLNLPIFLYKLSDSNQALADELYLKALNTYRAQSPNEFFYLSAYPFGSNREVVDLPSFALYKVPPRFVPNKLLQRLFMEAILTQAKATSQSTAASGLDFRAIQQLWLALTRLEPQIANLQPELSQASHGARESLFSLLSPPTQVRLTAKVGDSTPPTTLSFSEQVKLAEKEPNLNRHDYLLVQLLLRASDTVSLEDVLSACDKISDSKVRQEVLIWIYFWRTQSAIKEKRFEDARRLATNVDELDQRTYLYSEIARELLTSIESESQARRVLDEVHQAALKAPNTVMTARSLLAVAYLYLKIDLNSSILVISDAVKVINRIEAPDFSNSVVMRKIEGKEYGVYAAIQAPGFSPENVFRSLLKLSPEDALLQAGGLSDKNLRALTMLAIAEACLQQPQPGGTRNSRKY
ncbi:MAG TPA: hypothetical protein VJT69_20385 [Pyrinomonadaceae bacterium]|nr:hypothetical protein [Pyrinomonadaceae bacterium]